jgi:hypothetical protein
MPEFIAIPERVEDGRCYRYTRHSFRDIGQDDFTQPPSQNPDMFMKCFNALPSINGVMQRRWGYRLFDPKIDSGANPDDDEKT